MKAIRGTFRLLWMGMLLLSFSCGVKKFIPEGEKLYTGKTIRIDGPLGKKEKQELAKELSALVRPEPNSKFLGQRFGLWAHYKGNKEKPGFINRFLAKKFGQKPVYLSQLPIEKTASLLINRLENKGYFFSSVGHEVREGRKYASITYSLTLGEPYRIAQFVWEGDSSALAEEIKRNMDNSLLTKGQRFDLDLLKQERERIDEALKMLGYYNFNPDLLIFEADTNTYEDRQLDLFLRLKSNVPEKALHPYVIRKVEVFPDYTYGGTLNGSDTVYIRQKAIIQNEMVFKPHLLEPYVLFQVGQRYNPQLSRLSSNRLSNIGNFRFVNIRYEQNDSLKNEDGTYNLDAKVLLSPLNKRSLRAEIQGVTKSNSFAGPALVLNYSNRNIFHGGEILTLTGKVGYETQLASGNRTPIQSVEFGVQGNLLYPRVIFPVPLMNRFQFAMPKTKIGLGYEFLNRTDLYRINSYNASFGYLWNANRYVFHEFNPINLNIFNLGRTTPVFEEILEANPFLRRSFEQQFILGLNYTFNYNQLVDKERKNALFLEATADLAGNSLRGLRSLTGGGDFNRVFGLEYAQYVKTELDLRFYHRFTQEHLLIGRFFGGVGVPLGNSLSLPFAKQFFSGGPRSVRAFRIRSLGPGSFVPQDATGTGGFFDQAGDIRLEGNAEYRFPFNKYLKGAFFVDAGNVWLFKENEALPGGQFSEKWLEQLGVGAGFGMRVDIQVFVLRFDLAVPLRRPWLPDQERWNRSLDLGDPNWRRDNLILNFAIGYPF